MRRAFKKRPDMMSSLVSGALSRHGIAKQVEAAMIVKRANEVLDDIMREEYRVDVRVVSFVQTDLNVACRHAQARHMIEGMRVQLCEDLERHFPAISIENIFCRIDPHKLESTSEIL